MALLQGRLQLQEQASQQAAAPPGPPSVPSMVQAYEARTTRQGQPGSVELLGTPGGSPGSAELLGGLEKQQQEKLRQVRQDELRAQQLHQEQQEILQRQGTLKPLDPDAIAMGSSRAMT